MSARANPRWLQSFAAYDARRDRWRARPLAVGALLLGVVACAVAGLFVVRTLTDRVSVASIPDASGVMEVGRPLTWQVWQQPDGRYRLPAEVQAFVRQDMERALAWWQANLHHPDELEANLAVYFSGPELARRRQSVQDCRRHDAVGIVYAEAASSDGGGADVLDADQSGRQVWMTWSFEQRQAALYSLSDSTLVPGSQTVLPAVQITYRMVFEAESRRWRVDELVRQEAQ